MAMGRLIYALNVSLDGYVETPDHGLEWATVDDELHTWFNDRFRELAASIYGRGLYETMAAHWPYAADDPDATPVELEFARIWNATPRYVFSSSLAHVNWNSRLIRDGVDEGFARVRAEVDGDIEVGGATLAASFIQRGLVDVYQLIVHPVAIGAGTPYFPEGHPPQALRLTDIHRFGSGVVLLEYVPADTDRPLQVG
jgi:dihydrofolate reductase